MKPHIITLTLAVTLGLVNLGASSRGQLPKGQVLLQPAQITTDSRNDRTVSAPGRGNPWLNLGQGQTALTALLTQPEAFFTVINTNDAGAGSLRQAIRSEEHTSELQSHSDLVCRLLLEKKKTTS